MFRPEVAERVKAGLEKRQQVHSEETRVSATWALLRGHEWALWETRDCAMRALWETRMRAHSEEDECAPCGQLFIA